MSGFRRPLSARSLERATSGNKREAKYSIEYAANNGRSKQTNEAENRGSFCHMQTNTKVSGKSLGIQGVARAGAANWTAMTSMPRPLELGQVDLHYPTSSSDTPVDSNFFFEMNRCTVHYIHLEPLAPQVNLDSAPCTRTHAVKTLGSAYLINSQQECSSSA